MICVPIPTHLAICSDHRKACRARTSAVTSRSPHRTDLGLTTERCVIALRSMFRSKRIFIVAEPSPGHLHVLPESHKHRKPRWFPRRRAQSIHRMRVGMSAHSSRNQSSPGDARSGPGRRAGRREVASAAGRYRPNGTRVSPGALGSSRSGKSTGSHYRCVRR